MLENKDTPSFIMSAEKLLILTALSHLKTKHQKRIKALSSMNSNTLGVTLTTWIKLIAACTTFLS